MPFNAKVLADTPLGQYARSVNAVQPQSERSSLRKGSRASALSVAHVAPALGPETVTVIHRYNHRRGGYYL
ncbi:unnamed protein product [Acanthoscelides obtectus]|uniref:Uncharacterized protein n=1 Tax=Acanthoscelides obtectus TaxID=200917 RepID=A0A9P0K0U9_ACAOB|nr:unnamed protein product [Acanthoscelides obtectus]CAK1629029.1 hypothetical protein AOBTE_LOCUS5539 [Acanthoscelides obtectus]